MTTSHRPEGKKTAKGVKMYTIDLASLSDDALETLHLRTATEIGRRATAEQVRARRFQELTETDCD